MKMAMKDGQILIREADNVQFTIIKSWGKMKWSRQTQTLSGPADIELLNRLAGLVNLPPSIEAERKKLNEVMAAVDRECSCQRLFTTRRKASPFNFCGKWGGIANDAGNNNGVFVLREQWL